MNLQHGYLNFSPRQLLSKEIRISDPSSPRQNRIPSVKGPHGSHSSPYRPVCFPAGTPSQEPSREELGGRAEMPALVQWEDWVLSRGGEGSGTGSAPSHQVLTALGHSPPIGFWKMELSSIRGVGWYAKPQPSTPPASPPSAQLAPGAWPTTMALKLAGCPRGIKGHVSHCADWE